MRPSKEAAEKLYELFYKVALRVAVEKSQTEKAS